MIELLFELLFGFIAEGLVELVFELAWHVARISLRAGKHAARITRAVDALVYSVAAMMAFGWGAHLANRPSEDFPWTIISTLTIAVVAALCSATGLSTPTTWHQVFRFDRRRLSRLALVSLVATSAMTVGYTTG